MAKQAYSKHQQGIIRRYYENIDTIALQRLGELVTELYLAETSAKQAKLWERVDKAMIQLKVKDKLRAHILKQAKVEVLAQHVEDWIKAAPANQ